MSVHCGDVHVHTRSFVYDEDAEHRKSCVVVWPLLHMRVKQAFTCCWKSPCLLSLLRLVATQRKYRIYANRCGPVFFVAAAAGNYIQEGLLFEIGLY